MIYTDYQPPMNWQAYPVAAQAAEPPATYMGDNSLVNSRFQNLKPKIDEVKIKLKDQLRQLGNDWFYKLEKVEAFKETVDTVPTWLKVCLAASCLTLFLLGRYIPKGFGSHDEIVFTLTVVGTFLFGPFLFIPSLIPIIQVCTIKEEQHKELEDEIKKLNNAVFKHEQVARKLALLEDAPKLFEVLDHSRVDYIQANRRKGLIYDLSQISQSGATFETLLTKVGEISRKSMNPVTDAELLSYVFEQK